MNEKHTLETIALALKIAAKMLSYLNDDKYVSLLRYIHRAKHEAEARLQALEDE